MHTQAYSWRTNNNNRFAKSSAEHKVYWSKLKKFEEQFFCAHPPNPRFPAWGRYPRAGALWSQEENIELFENFKDQCREDCKYLGFKELCELGYMHGRSASSIETQLKKLLGWSVFYQFFNFHA